MKRKRFSVEQIVATLKQIELGMTVAEASRQLGVSEQAIHRWKKFYGGLQSDQVRAARAAAWSVAGAAGRARGLVGRGNVQARLRGSRRLQGFRVLRAALVVEGLSCRRDERQLQST